MASARYRAAANYARRVLKAEGYPTRAAGTVLLALARLEDQDGFFALAHQLEEQMGADALENSPWYLLARTILLFKTNKMRPAVRALREFANRCEGGAFFLLNPMYQTPYLPCRPERATPGTFRTRQFGSRRHYLGHPRLAPWPTPAKMYRSSPRNLRAATAFSDAIAPTMSSMLGTTS